MTAPKIGPKKKFDMLRVKSASLSHIGYADGTLRVTFNSGKTYAYPATQAQFISLKGAESVGKHFHAHFGKLTGKLVE